MTGRNQEIEEESNRSAVILVVDDNEMNRDFLSRRLAKKGFTVDVAEDGFKALEWIDKNPCDLMLLDIMMPVMSGIEVLEKIRQTRDGTELPVIMATAKDTREDIVGALRLGANDYVTKPIDFPVVLARVNAQLGLKRANDRVRSLVREVERRNKFIRDVFGRYLTDEVAETLLDSPDGLALLENLRTLTQRFQQGLIDLGFETIPGDHPVVPLMLRDTERTHATVKHLHDNGVLATGLAFPVVPRGDEEIRFQVNADHTKGDIDAVLGILAAVA